MPETSETGSQPALRALLRGGDLAGSWVLDPGRSSIRLTNKVFGLLTVTGVFHEVHGHGSVSADGAASGTIMVAAASVDTGTARRDTHLRSAEIFACADHPDITFTARSIRPSGPGVAVTGALTVRGRTLPLSFDAVASVAGRGEVRLDATTRVDRTAFGLRWKGDVTAAKTTTLTIQAVFTRA